MAPGRDDQDHASGRLKEAPAAAIALGFKTGGRGEAIVVSDEQLARAAEIFDVRPGPVTSEESEVHRSSRPREDELPESTSSGTPPLGATGRSTNVNASEDWSWGETRGEFVCLQVGHLNQTREKPVAIDPSG